MLTAAAGFETAPQTPEGRTAHAAQSVRSRRWFKRHWPSFSCSFCSKRVALKTRRQDDRSTWVWRWLVTPPVQWDARLDEHGGEPACPGPFRQRAERWREPTYGHRSSPATGGGCFQTKGDQTPEGGDTMPPSEDSTLEEARSSLALTSGYSGKVPARVLHKSVFPFGILLSKRTGDTV